MYQRALLRLLAPEWPNRTIVWAGQGILDIAEYIGADPESVSEKAAPEAPSLENLASTSTGTVSTPYTVLTLVDRSGPRDIGVGHDRRTVGLWCGPPTRRPLERIREIWAGWEVRG